MAEPQKVHARNDKGQPICGSKKRNKDSICHDTYIDPINGRCRRHGGFSPRGVTAYAFKHGRCSSVLPDRLASRYKESLKDPELLNLRSEIALVDARVEELIGRLATNENAVDWTMAQGLVRHLSRSFEDGDFAQVGLDIQELSGVVEQALLDFTLWGEIHGALEQRRKLVESEQKRLVAMKQIVTTEQALTMLGTVVSIIKKYVDDPEKLRAMHEEFQTLSQ